MTQTTDTAVITALKDGVATVTLNRPERMNALNAAMRRDLTAALHEMGQAARVIVLTGAGRAFCSGQDLGDVMAEGTLDGAAMTRILHDEYEPMLMAIHDSPVPVIAAVNGAAAGAGANLALACDVVIAAHSASFVQAFARIGLLPDAGGTWTLPRQVGLARAMGLALFAEPVGAERAAAMGMIWEAVPDAEFAAVWQARAAHLAQGPALAYREIRKALRASGESDLSAQLAREAKAQGRLGDSADFREGVAAFLEKRGPRFQGC